MNFQGIQKMKTLLAALAMGVVLAGCSAGGKNSSTTPPPVVNPTASDLLVTVSTPSSDGLQNTGSQVATVTVTAVDANRNVVAAVPVSIVPDNTAVVTASSTTTNTSGVVTGTVSIGNDRSNRTINLVVTSGSIKKTASFNVVGNVLTATPSPAVIAPAPPARSSTISWTPAVPRSPTSAWRSPAARRPRARPTSTAISSSATRLRRRSKS